MQKLDTTFEPSLRKSTGAHYTPSALAQFVAKNILDQISETTPKNQLLKIVDPAVGDGELLFAVAREAYLQGFRNISLTGFDINVEAIESTQRLIQTDFPQAVLTLHHEDFLQHVLDKYMRSLLNQVPTDSLFDAVIANPPYVRTQVLGGAKAQQLSEAFDLTGRVDLYHAFLKAIEKVIKPEAVVGIIVSNRFMTTKSGE